MVVLMSWKVSQSTVAHQKHGERKVIIPCLKGTIRFFSGGPHFTSQIFCCGSSFSSLSMPRGGIRIVHCHYALRHSELLSRAGDMKLSTVHENDLILKFIQINQTNLPNGIFTHFTKKKCQKAHRVCLKKCH